MSHTTHDKNDSSIDSKNEAISSVMQQHDLAITNFAVQDTLLAAINAMALAQEQSSKRDEKLVTIMTSVNKNIEALIEQTKQTNDLIKHEGRLNRIQSALLHCNVGAFEYREGGKSNLGKISKSTECLAQRILTSFFHGKAHALPSSCHTGLPKTKGKELEARKIDFRKRLVGQLEALVGHNVQLLDKGDGVLHAMCV